MCYFITAAFPNSRLAAFRALVPRGMAAESGTPIPALTRCLPENFTQIFLTSGGCSCGQFVSREAAAFVPPRKDPAKIREKYLRKGWSDARIDRALAQRDAETPAVSPSVPGLDAQVKELISRFVTEQGELFIFVHFTQVRPRWNA